MHSPRVTPSRRRRSAALSALAVLGGAIVATVSAVGPASAESAPPVVDYWITPSSFIGDPSSTTFDFGDVPIDTISAPQVTTVTNTSGGPITPVLTAGNFPVGVFSATQNCTGHTLQAGQSCSISFVFQPGAAVAQSGTTTAALNGQSFTIGYAGNGVKAFLINPTSLDFGNVQNGFHSSTQAVTVTNVTGAAEAISGFVNPAGAFGASSDCAGTLAAGASCHMYFQFNPTTLGTQSATATGSWRTQSFSINLTGRSYKGAKPTTPYSITSTGLDLGDVALNNTSAPQSVTFTNISSVSVPTGVIGVVGSFTETNTCPSSLAPGASCTMNVLFHPAGLGTQNGSASGTWDGQAFAINLSGTGIRQFLITPVGFDFGLVRDGTVSATQSVAIKNVGQSITMPTLAWGGYPDIFPNSTDCSHIKLASGATCYLRFQYAPTFPENDEGTAFGSWNTQAFSVLLQGFGYAP
jgi:hypothetical protein